MKHRKFVFRAAMAMAVTLIASAASAQFPTKPVRFVVPYAPGAIADLVSRSVAEKVGADTGHATIVEFKPGASGAIGTEHVAKSDPDGHTLLLATLSHVTSPSMKKNLPWHPDDFKGVALLATVPAVGVVNAQVPANTLKEFVAYAKQNPGKLNYLGPGSGTSMHLNGELLNQVAGIDLGVVMYKGTAPGIPDLLSNRIAFAFLPIPLAQTHISTGKLKPLFVASSRRSSRMPDVPTADEAGYADAKVVSWFALLAPAKTPSERIVQLNKWVNAALATPEVEKRLASAGAETVKAISPQELDAMLAAEAARYAKLIKDAKIQAQ